jgi:hypothetical protein
LEVSHAEETPGRVQEEGSLSSILDDDECDLIVAGYSINPIH